MNSNAANAKHFDPCSDGLPDEARSKSTQEAKLLRSGSSVPAEMSTLPIPFIPQRHSLRLEPMRLCMTAGDRLAIRSDVLAWLANLLVTTSWEQVSDFSD